MHNDKTNSVVQLNLEGNKENMESFRESTKTMGAEWVERALTPPSCGMNGLMAKTHTSRSIKAIPVTALTLLFLDPKCPEAPEMLMPRYSSPKTFPLLASQILSQAVQMKNWEAFEFGTALAMDKMLRPVYFRMMFTSSNPLPIWACSQYH